MTVEKFRMGIINRMHTRNVLPKAQIILGEYYTLKRVCTVFAAHWNSESAVFMSAQRMNR